MSTQVFDELEIHPAMTSDEFNNRFLIETLKTEFNLNRSRKEEERREKEEREEKRRVERAERVLRKEKKEKERRENEEREERRRVERERAMAKFEKGKENVRESVKRKLKEDAGKILPLGARAKAAKLEREKPRFAKITKGDRLGWSLKCGYKVNL